MSSVVRLLDPEMRFAFDADDHAAIARLVHAETGIVLAPHKSQLVYGRLAPRVRANGFKRFADYVRLILTDAAERLQALEALTTNHTSFFREDHHFDHFSAEVWPALARRLDEQGRVRLWSAACSSGEESFSIAMTLLGPNRDAARNILRGDLSILATDIAASVLEKGRAGRFASSAVATVPPALRDAWLLRDGDVTEVRPELRSLIAFRTLNLLDPWPMRQPFDAIFCRNVMIYFDEPTKARLQARLADQLAEGGTLYIGHSERLMPDVAERFACVDRTAFRKIVP